MHKIGNAGIIVNFVFPYICSFLPCLQHMILANIKLDISKFNWITFQDCKLHWSSSFLITQLKRSWQFWHFFIVESLWKPWCDNTCTRSCLIIWTVMSLLNWQLVRVGRKFSYFAWTVWLPLVLSTKLNFSGARYVTNFIGHGQPLALAKIRGNTGLKFHHSLILW